MEGQEESFFLASLEAGERLRLLVNGAVCGS